MGYLIYENQFCTVEGKPSNFQMMQEVKIDVLYSTSLPDIMGKSKNEGLFIELINELESRQRFQQLFDDAKSYYYNDEIKGIYLYFRKEERMIRWEKAQALDVTSMDRNTLGLKVELIKLLDKKEYENFNSFFTAIQCCIIVKLKRCRPRIYMY